MSYTVISIIILVVILTIFLFINFDYNKKYKKTEKDLYYEALDQLLTGKLKEAYATLLALIKNDTNNVKAYLKLGQVLREIGKPERALKVHKSLLIRKDLTSYERIELLKNISLDYRNINNIGIIFDYLRSKFEFILTISHKQEIRQHINYQIHLRQDENKLSYVVN